MSRSSVGSHPLRVRFGEFELDEANALLLRGGSAIPLAPTPFGLLCALVRQQGSLLTKHALLDQVWGHSYVSDSVLKTAISDLRTVLVDDAREGGIVAGAGEAGCIGVPAAVVNAVIDALSPFGIEHLDMPLTSDRIWTAIRDVKLKQDRTP